MEFTLLFYEPKSDFDARTSSEATTFFSPWRTYMSAMGDAGVMRGGKPLQAPSTGATVRRRGDARDVLDGPYSETREQLGGYVIIDVPDMAKALEWAERAPCAQTGAVEVRPVMLMDSAYR